MQLEFWFEFASTYSYPAACRIGALAKQAGVALVWRPFLLGPIFGQQGWNDSPFNIYPAKGRYMWRDMERICQEQGLPLRHPSRFPRNGLGAARIALIAAAEGWAEQFVPAVYRANFGADREISDPAVLAEILAALGRNPQAVMGQAEAAANKEALKAQTAQAMAKGLFGAPSFTVGGELFWGNDRLEQALAWAKRG